MITRIWSAQTTRHQAPQYADHLRSHVLPKLRKLEGYEGAMLLQRDGPKEVEILVISFWESLEAIRRFAGDHAEEAVVADEAASLLTDFDRTVRHYELVVKEGPL